MSDTKNSGDVSTSRGAALLVATLSSFLTPLMGSTVIVALRRIQEAFSLDAVTLSWVSMSVLLAAATFLVPFGRIADIYGRKKIFVYGTGLYTLASLFAAIAPSTAFLISFRSLQGIGAAMIFGTGMAILTSVFPPNERGRALGINVAAVYIGLSIGPPLGGFLTQYFGWRSVFYVNLPLGLITLVVALWKLKGEWAEAKGEKFDFIGSILYGLSLIALVLGFSKLPAMTGMWLIAGGTVGIFAFIQWEMRTKSPVLNITLFRNNTVFSLSNLAALINYMATNAVTFLLSLYLQYIEGLTPQ
ncbi:MAG TPA: MFS transporter, partial [Dehalococcoidales bacterium]